MLILGLSVGEERYGIEATRVIEVVPLIPLKKVPLAEPSIKGLFNYRGNPTPVVDLCQIFEHRDCNNSLSSRIVIIHYISLSGDARPIGLIAEQVTDIIRCEISKMSNSGIEDTGNDFLGQIYNSPNGMIQLIDTSRILPESISKQLMKELT